MSEAAANAAARKVFERHAAQLRGASQSAAREMLAVYERAAREIVARLAALPIDSLDAVRYQAILGQLREGVVTLWRQVGGAMTAQEVAAVELAQRQLAEQLAALAKRFGDADPRFLEELRTRSAGAFRALYPDASDRLATVREGVQAAGTARMDAAVRTELAVSLATGEPFFGPQSTFSRLRKVVDGSAYRVEMVARTEHSRAYNAAHHAELVGANEREGMDYRKTAMIVFDSRTAADSLGLNAWLQSRGGSIPLDEPFRDGAGRLYMHPPGRPNDREVEVPWRASWGDGDTVSAITGDVAPPARRLAAV